VTERHLTLYRLWSSSGAGILVSGNIQVDRRYLERAGNVAIDLDAPHTYDERQREMLREWLRVSKAHGSLFIGQLSCAGAKAPGYTTDETIGPSAAPAGTIPAGSRRQSELPARVREATVAELDALVGKFAHAAKVLAECGWDGVQPHAAHAYLVSSFLSPATNQRQDEYGGPLENRARLLLRIVDAIREVVPPDFLLSVKIHCSDFMEEGFTLAEAEVVCQWLVEAGVELIELSGPHPC